MYTTLVLILFLVAVYGERRLQFNQEGKFKVVQFTDLHFGGAYEEDLATLAVQGTVLHEEKPDLVVITGDLVSGYHWNGNDENWFSHYYRQLIEPMRVRNISWAVALGNHDVEADLTGSEIIELDTAQPLSLTQMGPTNIGGAGNYKLPIYTNSTSNELGQVLWIFDSGHNGCQGVPGWGCIGSGQINWYKNESSTINKASGRAIPGLAFFHIPLYEHLDLWNSKPVYGNLGEEVGVCCSAVNTGLYSAMREMGDIKHVFCGHDHNNDYYGDYNGINLGYGRKSGYGGYGPPRGWKHGARVIEITQNDFQIKTWLRLEDGSVEHQVQQYPGSSNQFMGCCDMEGHGRESTFFLQDLYVYLVNSTWLLLIIAVAYLTKRVYSKCRVGGATGGGQEGAYLPLSLMRSDSN